MVTSTNGIVPGMAPDPKNAAYANMSLEEQIVLSGIVALAGEQGPLIPARVINGQLVMHLNQHVGPLLPLFGNPPIEESGGFQFVSVPYTAKNVGIINRNTNARLRGPAYFALGYAGRFDPREQQRQTIDFFTQNERAYCFNGLGSGKTASAIWAAEYLRSQRLVKRVLVVSTLSTTRAVWQQELMNLYPTRGSVIVRGTKAQRNKLVASGSDYTIINHDGVKTTYDALMAEDFDLVILDEGSVYRNPTSELSKKTTKLCEDKRTWLMTATPTPKGPMDAYGLAKLVTPSRVPKSKYQYQQSVEMKVSQFVWVPRKGSDDIVFNAMQPAIRIRTEDCVDLPPVVNIVRDVPLTKEQEKARKDMIENFVFQMQQSGEPITAANAGDVSNKVLQICQGSLKTGENSSTDLDWTPRFDELCSLVDQAEGKTIVFAPYRAVCSRLKKELEAKYGAGSVAFMIGGQSQGKRNEALDSFKNNPKCQILVAHPKTAGHGLNLTEANVTVWFGVRSDAEIYEQACARMVRPGQTRSMILAHLVGSPEERRILDKLQKRMDTQREIMDMVSDYMQGNY